MEIVKKSTLWFVLRSIKQILLRCRIGMLPFPPVAAPRLVFCVRFPHRSCQLEALPPVRASLRSVYSPCVFFFFPLSSSSPPCRLLLFTLPSKASLERQGLWRFRWDGFACETLCAHLQIPEMETKRKMRVRWTRERNAPGNGGARARGPGGGSCVDSMSCNGRRVVLGGGTAGSWPSDRRRVAPLQRRPAI